MICLSLHYHHRERSRKGILVSKPKSRLEGSLTLFFCQAVCYVAVVALLVRAIALEYSVV